MAKTIDRLQQDHIHIAKLLNLLERELAVFDAAGNPDYDVFLSAAEYFLTYPDQSHHVREDLVYQKLLELDPAAARTAGDLHQEHSAIGRRVRKFAEALRNVLADVVIVRTTVHDVVTDFVQDQRRHMRMEETAFFPAALATLSASDWQEIEAQAPDAPDPLFGDDVETRFTELRQSLQTLDAEG